MAVLKKKLGSEGDANPNSTGAVWNSASYLNRILQISTRAPEVCPPRPLPGMLGRGAVKQCDRRNRRPMAYIFRILILRNHASSPWFCNEIGHSLCGCSLSISST